MLSGKDNNQWDIAWIQINNSVPSGFVPFFSGPAPAAGKNFSSINNPAYEAAATKASGLTGSDACDAWADAEWMTRRAGGNPVFEPMSTYEVHLGSWRPGLSYRELAETLVPYARALIDAALLTPQGKVAFQSEDALDALGALQHLAINARRNNVITTPTMRAVVKATT